MRDYAVVINDCAAPARPNPLQVRTRASTFGEVNFAFNISNIASGLPRQLTDAELDFVEMLVHLFAVDLACVRGDGDLEWARNIEAWFPVRDPDYWDEQAVSLQGIFNDFTYDRLQLHFVPESAPMDPPRLSRAKFPVVDRVALLSGGIDSFVGAASLLASDQRPLLLSHTASGATNTAQTRVEEVLKTRSAGVKRVRFAAQRARGMAFPGEEKSQRSRTFLYLGLAALAAVKLDLEDVYLNENGVMAVHAPMTAARIGSLSTRTASPPILDRVAIVLGRLLEAPISIHNNLINSTKPEVVQIARDLDIHEQLLHTVSCWQIGRTRLHCGYCAPCIMRRISCSSSSVTDVDYDFDVFDDPDVLSDARIKDNVTHLLAYTRSLRLMDDFEILLEYPELFNGGSQISSANAIALHRRWAHEVERVYVPTRVAQELS